MRLRLRRLSLQKLRDPVLFVVGLMGIGYETISGGAEKPTLIIAFVGMLGLPLFIKNDKEEGTPPPPPPPAAAVPPPPSPTPPSAP